MLTESRLYLSTCALEWWQRMVSAVQNHSDKFMRPLVHKWMQNYLARSASSTAHGADLLEQRRGSKPQREPRPVPSQPAAGGGRRHCRSTPWNPWDYGMNPSRPLLSNAAMALGFFFSPLSFFNQGRKSVSSVFSILPQLVGSFSFAP